MGKSLNRKRTKIVATISDRNCEPDFLRKLYDAGMDVVRINSAHLTTEGASAIIKNIRSVSDKIAILLDTKGPEIRTTECPEPIEFNKGQKVLISGKNEVTTAEVINFNYREIAGHVPVGSFILIDDGGLEIKITGKNKE
ncbi:MAG: pyruvate kinase, partial [Bacteroidales bacterium]|nr:pyruvate kinase [Bacteroidales bacterium]